MAEPRARKALGGTNQRQAKKERKKARNLHTSNPGSPVRERKSTRIVLLFVVLLLGYFYSGVQRISAGVILPHLGRTLGFSAALVGFLSSLFFYSYGFTQNVWGAISDRLGPLRSCAIGMGLAAAGSALVLLSPEPLFLGLSRFLCGLGLASFFTGIYIYAALAFPEDEYPFWVGFVQVIGNLGTVAAVAPLGFLMDAFGYRGVYTILTVWALCVSGTLWLTRNSHIRIHAAPAETPKYEGLGAIVRLTWEDIKHGYRFIAGNRSVGLIVFAWSVVSAAVMALQGLWGVSWVSVSSGATESTARFWTTLVSMGLVIGAICGARAAARYRDIRGGMLAILCPLSCAWIVYLVFSWLRLPAHVTGIVGFLVGVGSSTCMVYSISTIKSLVPLSRAGLAIGTGQMLLYVAVIVVQWGSGVIINLFPGAEQGTYLNRGFLLAFGVMTALVLLSALFAWRMPPTSTHSK